MILQEELCGSAERGERNKRKGREEGGNKGKHLVGQSSGNQPLIRHLKKDGVNAEHLYSLKIVFSEHSVMGLQAHHRNIESWNC